MKILQNQQNLKRKVDKMVTIRNNWENKWIYEFILNTNEIEDCPRNILLKNIKK